MAIQQFQSEEVSTGRLGVFETAMAKEEQAIGLTSAEIQGDSAGSLGVPLGQRQVRVGPIEGDRLQGLHALTAELQITMDTDPWVTQLGQA